MSPELDKPVIRASHVEIIFRDEYLTRADMWRLVVAVLSNKMLHKGQRIWFMGTIKALIQTIFVQGRKVQSAFFDPSTKPIFRSESARYVLFIQMSKEMWDFDADSTGEIMFSKVINGFLPELFNRWKQRNVKHLISIVLFTRLIYEQPYTKEISPQEPEVSRSKNSTMGATSHQDFYRVVVSDLAGGQWDSILHQLKSEFKVFLRDVSITRPENFQHQPLGAGLSALSSSSPEFVIAGRPSTAMRGNILEAINLASSQFSCDHIDRDLVRTGVSIAIITPGTGVFEVDYKLLIQTTEKLIENGVGIDLVCLSRMPLHSVPLFKYRQSSNQLREAKKTPKANIDDRAGDLPPNSISSTSSPQTSARVLNPIEDIRSRDGHFLNSNTGYWLYGIPHWIDVSFWTSSEEHQSAIPRGLMSNANRIKLERKSFVPRVRMYQLQMMGVMEDGMSDISTPHFSGRIATAMSLSNGTSKSQIQDTDNPLHAVARYQRKIVKGIHVEKAVGTEVSGISIAYGGQLSYEWMDEYDRMVFCHPWNRMAKEISVKEIEEYGKMTETHRYPDHEKFSLGNLAIAGSSIDRRKLDLKGKDTFDSAKKDEVLAQHNMHERESTRSTSRSKAPSLQQVRTSRQLSFGPRGFTGALKASASTEITAEHAKSGLYSGRGNKVRSTTKGRNVGLLGNHTAARVHKPSEFSSTPSRSREAALEVSDGRSQIFSRPISIGESAVAHMKADEGHIKGNEESCYVHDFTVESESSATKETSKFSLDLATSIDAYSKIALSPGSSVAPWLTILNPSNPRQMNITLASRLGRWQHVFPRPLRASKIKWKSLCAPAAVPLTTEDFPSYAQITAEYDENSYEVLSLQEEDFPENSRSPDWLLKEMVAFRFTQGFQVVVGSRVEESMNLAPNHAVDIFADYVFPISGGTILMSRGNLIHQLSYLEGGAIAVRCLTRRTMAPSLSDYFEDAPSLYRPAIRTMHAHVYNIQLINMSPERPEPFWETIDNFIAYQHNSQKEPMLEQIRSWRARYVLIPVDPPLSGRHALQSLNEDNEEEIRLEGIRKLSQIWQRFRYVSPRSHRFQAVDHNRKDTNPLDIVYRTQNPSTVIEVELESVSGSEPTGKPLQLLPDSDLYQRSNLDLMSLAQVMQSDKGVRMMDRRWHWRLHYKCFVGVEFTNWLLDNFRDVETREDAVELGNELMKSGLFKHVERRHQFRDGNFFYQIASDYHAPNRSRLGRPDASVPPTPSSECIGQEASKIPGSHRSTSVATQEDRGPPRSSAKKQRLGVALSKSLLYDVDIRKRSHRPEIVTLHYDRLHNPDNCFHILLEWMNCTAKFIEDAVVSWAATVERFGLRLVELPLGEAAAITKLHPFRGPSLVGLAVRPPGEQPPSLSNMTPLSTSAKCENHPYQRAILKKFQFVLDLEAASDFSSDVEVTYSWGKPTYTYPQYIHRSGVSLAQITDDGDFVLLANRLCNNRSTATQESDKTHYMDAPRTSSRYSPVRGSNHPGSPRPSPYSSPAIRAAHEGSSLSGTYPRLTQPTASITPEQILEEFEAFCQDKVALNQFYDQIRSQGLSTGGSSPIWEGDIPALGLPPSLTLEEASPSLSPKGKI